MKRYLPLVIVSLVALLSITGGAVLYRAKRLPAPNAPKQGSLTEETDVGHIRGPTDAPVTLEEAERSHILHALRQTEGIVGGPNGAAARLGLPRTTLLSKMRRLGISPSQQSSTLARAIAARP